MNLFRYQTQYSWPTRYRDEIPVFLNFDMVVQKTWVDYGPLNIEH